jgi:pyruvate dehydrogenase E2 component (dihydrolipoamide acetyltransferase)
MAVYIPIPKLGMNMTRATLIEWKAKEGERVEKGNVVLTIETEKTGWEITAEASGFLHILVEEGAEVPVSRVVGFIAETREELNALQKEPPREIFTTMAEVKEAPLGAMTQVAAETVSKAVASGERIRISPVARKMAEEHMIDISKVAGTGPEGRIIKDDIEREMEARKRKEATGIVSEVYQGRRVKTSTPLKGMRKTIAEHMHRSLSVSAQLTVMGELDVTELVKLRENFLSQEQIIGTRVTYTEILIFTIAKTLKDYPLLNCSLIDNEIKLWEDINIGVAVSLGDKGEKGLIVPVVKNADQKSIVEISQTTKGLVEKAQAGKLMPDDVTGGTFTLTSIGPRGVSFYQTPIINQPETAILGTGRITDRAVVRDSQIVIAPIMPFSLTYDHRVIDGAAAENFLARLRELLETPGLLLL